MIEAAHFLNNFHFFTFFSEIDHPSNEKLWTVPPPNVSLLVLQLGWQLKFRYFVGNEFFWWQKEKYSSSACGTLWHHNDHYHHNHNHRVAHCGPESVRAGSWRRLPHFQTWQAPTPEHSFIIIIIIIIIIAIIIIITISIIVIIAIDHDLDRNGSKIFLSDLC